MNLAASLVKINDIKNGDNTKVNDAENNVDEEVAEKIMKVESDLDNLKNKLDRQNGFKYWAIAFFTILDFILFFWVIIPIINYLLNNLQPASKL